MDLNKIQPHAREAYIKRHTESVRKKYKTYTDRIKELHERADRQVKFLTSPKRYEHPYPNMWSWDDVLDCYIDIESQRYWLQRLVDSEGMYLI